MDSRGDRSMLIGISAVLRGRLADPAAVRALALAADQLGYSSLWVSDVPLSAEGGMATPAPTGEDVLDPLAMLANTAAVTTQVRLGARVVVDPEWGAAAGLVRALLSVDRLSDGRLTVGLDVAPGAGSGPDREDRVGLEVLDRLDDRPRPLVLVAGADPSASPAAAELVGRVDGWLATGVGPDELGARWARVRTHLAGTGTGDDLRLVVHAAVALTATATATAAGPRPPYTGDAAQIAADLHAARHAGAAEVVLGVAGDPGLDEALDVYARVAEAVEAGVPPSPR